MKRFYMFVALLAGTITLWAQIVPTKMNIKKTDGTETVINFSDISEITFLGEEKKDEPLPADAKTYAIAIPAVTDDIEPCVWKVMNGDDQVAELCYEYIRYAEGDELIANERMLVVYPMGANGRTDLTKGYVIANGGSIVWNTETNTCQYTAGTAAIAPATLFLAEGRFAATSEAAEKIATTQVKDQLIDKRGNETETYDVVKVGTQYWMGQNLRATMLTDGRSIQMFKSTQGDAWNNTTAPAYHVFLDGQDEGAEIKKTWGCMYNGYSVFDGNLAPEDWEIPMLEDWQLLKTYLAKSQSGKVKSTTEWNDTPGNGNNLTGLDIKPGGLFLNASDYTDLYQWSRATYWTSDELTDATFGTKALGAIYIYTSIAVYNTEGNPFATHGYNWGHYVRCIRR